MLPRKNSMLACLGLALLAPTVFAQDDSAPSDVEIRKAWSYLHPDEKDEVAEWFRAEVSYLDSYQNTMIRYILGDEERDRGSWPMVEELTFYDPVKHCPGDPIPRKLVDPESSEAEAARQAYWPALGDPLYKIYVYDWGSGELRRQDDERNADVIFANGIQGYPPLLDLVEAILLRRMDDGSQTLVLDAFDHMYTDRTGKAFGDVTLYDAWCSGRAFEMPDVDVLGIYHTVVDDWTSYVAPIPGQYHKELYAKIGDLFVPAKRHRQLLEAIVATYLRGKAVPRSIYEPHTLMFNGLWEKHSGVPEKFARELPDAGGWEKYVEDLAKYDEGQAFFEAADNRLKWLENERLQVKATLVRVMKEFGAMDRRKLPAREEKKSKE